MTVSETIKVLSEEIICPLQIFQRGQQKCIYKVKDSWMKQQNKDFASWTVRFVNTYVKTKKNHKLLFNLLVMYGGSYMFRHYIAILRERS
jgi:hypothetical protein